jgi:transglutaminase-like putative cysteine protease
MPARRGRCQSWPRAAVSRFANDRLNHAMRYKVLHTTTYTYSDAVPICHNEVHLIPRDAARQACLYNRLRIKPQPSVMEQRIDYFGNRVTSFAIEQAHQKLTVAALSRVHVTPAPPASDPSVSAPWEDVRDALQSYSDLVEVYQFVFDSTLINASAALRAYAEPSFTPRRPIVAAALDLCERIHRDFIYDPEATTVSTPLPDVLQLKRGVCQDFAHLAIGCVRSLGLAARYVSGYLLTQPPPGRQRLVGSDASHAWLGVYTGNLGWLDIDPTNNVVPSLEHITLAWGRDYSDVCPIQGVFIGGGQHGLSVSVDVSPIG